MQMTPIYSYYLNTVPYMQQLRPCLDLKQGSRRAYGTAVHVEV